MKRYLSLLIVVVLCLSALTMSGCARRNFVEIGPDQTAFAIPLTGDRGNQAQLFTEEYLTKNQVSAKRYQIDFVKVRESNFGPGKWVPAVKLVVIDLKPVTRSWTGDTSTGTDVKNQALVAETKESIGFSAEMNCSASVSEADAAKFAHYYYGKPLEEVIDTQIRPYAQQLFTEKAATYTLDELLVNKGELTKYVREGTTKFFATRGINILSLGMQGEVSYLNKSIQESIDKRIQSKNDYLAQQAQNKKKVEMAEAAAREAKLLSGETAIRLRELDIAKTNAETRRALADKWDGKMPTTMVPGGATPLLNLSPAN